MRQKRDSKPVEHQSSQFGIFAGPHAVRIPPMEKIRIVLEGLRGEGENCGALP